MTFYSCNKNESSDLRQQNNQPLVKLEKDNQPFLHSEGYLIFDCEEKFTEFLSTKSQNQDNPLIVDQQYGYKSYLNNVNALSTNNELLEDEYLSATLNEHGVVGVANYTFKLLPASEEVFAIKHLDRSLNDIRQFVLATDADDLPKGAMIFSFEDDVFGLIDDNTSCEPIPRCGDDCVRGEQDKKEKNLIV